MIKCICLKKAKESKTKSKCRKSIGRCMKYSFNHVITTVSCLMLDANMLKTCVASHGNTTRTKVVYIGLLPSVDEEGFLAHVCRIAP